MQLPHPLVCCLGFFVWLGFCLVGCCGFLCMWLLVLVFFPLIIVVLGVNWKYTGSADCISTRKKTEHLTNTVLHFSGLVSSLTLGFSISGYRVFVDCPSKKHPIMLVVLIIPPINLVWRFLPSNAECHRLVQSIIFNFKTGIIYCWVELKLSKSIAI